MKGLPAVPKPIDAPGEAGAVQVDPHDHIGVRILVGVDRGERELVFLPDMQRAGDNRGPRVQEAEGQKRNTKQILHGG